MLALTLAPWDRGSLEDAAERSLLDAERKAYAAQERVLQVVSFPPATRLQKFDPAFLLCCTPLKEIEVDESAAQRRMEAKDATQAIQVLQAYGIA